MLPRELVEKIEQKRVIVFLGAGVSLSARDKENIRVFPTWNELLEKIADLAIEEGVKKGAALKHAIGAFETPMLLSMVEGIKEEISGECWRKFIRETFTVSTKEVTSESLSHFSLISNINVPLTITANYDDLFEIASEGKFKTWTQKNSAEVGDFLNGELNEKALWHIHGHVNEITSIILCSSDYNKLYYDENSEVAFRHSRHLLKRIAEQYSFLFIGFSLEDPFVLELIKETTDNNQGQIPPYYAVCLESETEKKTKSLENLIPLTIKDYEDGYIRLLKELSNIENKDNAVSSTIIPPIIRNNLPEAEYLDTGFFGAQRITQCLNIKENILKCRDFIFTIQGEGGVGKSAMARYIASLFMEDDEPAFDNICWVSAKTEMLTFEGTQSIKGAISTFNDMQAEIGLFFDSDFDVEQIDVEALLKSIKPDSLIVLDNLETISEPSLDYFLSNLPLNCKVLTTSRRAIDKGLRYSPCELSNEDAKALATSYFSYLTAGAQEDIVSVNYDSLVSKLHKNPLAIKWFIIGLYKGVEPNKLFKLHESEVLRFCIHNIYCKLSSSGKAILDVLRLTGELYSYSKICYITGKPYSNIEDIILDELFKQSLINREPVGNRYNIKIKPRVQSYLNQVLPLEEKFVKDVSKRESRLKGRLSNFIADEKNKPYNQYTLIGVNDDTVVAAIILGEVLKGIGNTPSSKLFEKVAEAKNNSPEYYEVSRVEASLLLNEDQRHRAKISYQNGMDKGGAQVSQYLYHYARFLMGKGNGKSDEFFSIT